jgi:peptidoglycan hydrolase-like protein with peptidoglycan-binding domain
MNKVRLGILLGLLTLVVAACGGGADEATTTSSTTNVAAPSTTQATTTTTLPPTTTTLSTLGATSTMIVVQQDLTALGYFTGTVDGIAGDETRAAVAKFQADAGIDADGEFGSNTDAALVPLLQADKDYITEVQETLIELEFYGGPVDGDFGKGTVKGVELLQKSCELEETGELDIKTRLCLGGHL